MRARNPRRPNWSSADEVKEYALRRWGRAHWLERGNTDTWPEFASWLRVVTAGDPEPVRTHALQVADVLEHEPGLVIDFPLAVDPVKPPALAERGFLRPARSTLNPGLALNTIKVLYRQPDTLALWGIPYEMRRGQQPRDLWERRGDSWIWLGSPGWYGSMSKSDQAAVKAFLDQHREAVPENPHEWSLLADFESNPRSPGLSPMLDELENLLGPLSKGHKQAILDYIEDPTEEGWDRIYGLILTPDSLRLSTLWQWVHHVDPSFPMSRPSRGRWPRIPDPFTVARAIRAAAGQRAPNSISALRHRLMPPGSW